QKAQRDADRAYAEHAAAAEAPTLHPPPQQQHQVPPHIPEQQQYLDFEMGMADSMYEQFYRMDWGLPHFSPL
ncbi:hypothetical protein A2U01_0109292, partial [Trifolium medium]|nr:hypothetical protein [Trifolium medium]